jgi:hypothetical protein
VQQIKEILAAPSPYRNGEQSAATVKAELRRRFGSQIANEYRPELCRSFAQWKKLLYFPIPNTKAIKIVTIIEKENGRGEIEKIPKIVNLFNINQVRKLGSNTGNSARS